MREPLKEKTEPSRLIGLPTAESLKEKTIPKSIYGIPTALPSWIYDEESLGSTQPARRGRKPLDPAVVKQRKELAEIEKAKKRMERQAMREAREASRPSPRPRGRPSKEGAREKEGAATESGYEN